MNHRCGVLSEVVLNMLHRLLCGPVRLAQNVVRDSGRYENSPALGSKRQRDRKTVERTTERVSVPRALARWISAQLAH